MRTDGGLPPPSPIRLMEGHGGGFTRHRCAATALLLHWQKPHPFTKPPEKEGLNVPSWQEATTARPVFDKRRVGQSATVLHGYTPRHIPVVRIAVSLHTLLQVTSGQRASSGGATQAPVPSGLDVSCSACARSRAQPCTIHQENATAARTTTAWRALRRGFKPLRTNSFRSGPAARCPRVGRHDQQYPRCRRWWCQ